MFRRPGFHFGAFVSGFDLAVMASFSSLEMLVRRRAESAPHFLSLWRTHWVLVTGISVCLLANLVCGNMSLHSLNYTTKVLVTIERFSQCT
jgi:hypothetical protein